MASDVIDAFDDMIENSIDDVTVTSSGTIK